MMPGMPTATIIAVSALLAGPQAPPQGAPREPLAQPRAVMPENTPTPSATILLADFDHPPTVALSWTTREGERVEIVGARPYAGDRGRTLLGRNVECFVAVGGTRLTKGAGRPEGAIVRVGFYKKDATALFFDDIAENGRVRIELSGVRFNQPAGALAQSVIQHLKFAPEQLEVCSLPTDARDQFNTASPTDTLNGRVQPDIDARLGVLAAGPPDQGSCAVTTHADGSLTLVCEFTYPLLRHLQDPWNSGVPGTFVEPIHFHVEFEALPTRVLERIEAGELPWPPPDRMLDETGDQPGVSGDDE